jgi:glycosyltransferase involved in cell wall biosynthesis
VVRELLRTLAARADDARFLLYARRRWADVELDDRFRWRLHGGSDPVWHLRTARQANRECDVFLATNSYVTPLFLRIPTVTMVMDLVTFDPSMRPNRRSMLIERATLGRAVRRSTKMLAISRATADALIGRLPRAAAKTVVAPLGVAATLDPTPPAGDAPVAAAESGDSLDPPGAGTRLPAPGFVLAVGTLEPRKNLPRLVAAFGTLEDSLQERHPLVVVGRSGWETGQTLAALRSLGHRCVALGYVADEDLGELYRRCDVFCYPSLGEGFGLPVLEAMAAGAAVVTSNLSSLPEVGGDAVEYVDPASVESIAAGLRRVLEDDGRRRELEQRGRVRARSFSWGRFTDTVMATLAAAAAEGRPRRLTN